MCVCVCVCMCVCLRNVPHRFRLLHPWTLSSDAVWRREVQLCWRKYITCMEWEVLWSLKPHPTSRMFSLLPAPAAMPAVCCSASLPHGFFPAEPGATIKSLKFPGHGVLSQQQKSKICFLFGSVVVIVILNLCVCVCVCICLCVCLVCICIYVVWVC